MKTIARGFYCFLFLSFPLYATVTYDGTDGVYLNVFSSNSENACTTCHSSSLVGSVARSSAPDGVDFDSYANSTSSDNAERASIRVNAGTMPPSGTLNATEQSLIAQWITDNKLENAAPEITTSAATSISKYQATFNGTASEGGASTTVEFDYGLASNSLINTKSATSPSGTGGGETAGSVSATQTSLSCGTTYYFRLEGTNSVGSDTGSTLNFATLDCNVAPTITSTAGTSATEDVQYSYQLTVSDSDDANNGTDLSFSLTNEPAGMSVSTTGLVTWTPTEGVTTSGTVTVSVQDGGEDGASADTEDFTVAVTAVNDAPTITSTAGTTATEDQQYSYQLTVSDPDDSNNGTDLTFALSNEPSGMTVSTTGLVTWTPGEVSTSGTVTVTLSDGGEDAASPDTENFTITVTAVNDEPVISSTAGATATEDVEYSYQVTVTDPDDNNNGTDLSFSLSGEPSGMAVSTTGLITWTATEGVTTSGSVRLTVSDGGEDGANPDTEDFTVTVTAVNDAPSITSTPSTSAIEDNEYSYQVTINDPDDSNNGSDISFSLSNEPSGMTVSTTGLVVWTPTNGITTSGLITVTASDGGEDSAVAATQDWTISIDSVNDQPVITSTAGTAATEDIQYQYQVAVTDPDDDNNGVDLTFGLSGAPSGMTISTTGLIAWTPENGVLTSGSVTVSVEDGLESGTVAATEDFTVSVTAVDDAPSITTTEITTATEDIAYQYDVDATDEEGVSLVYSLTTAPSGMTIDSGSGEINWTPTEGTDSESVVVSVTDGTTAVTQSFTITVTAVNDQPVITSTTETSATEDALYQYQVTSSDSEGTALSYSLTTSPTGMTIDATSGLINWTPDEGVLSEAVTVQVSDGVLTDTQSFTITVTPVNDGVVVSQPDAQTVTELSEWTLTLSVSDVDDENNGTDISFELLSSPSSSLSLSDMTVSNMGVLSWVPGQLSEGDYAIVVRVFDGLEDSAEAVQVTINLTVERLDSDADTVADYLDNCPSTANTDQLDTDTDGVGNTCDLDDDGDGISDLAETTNGLDPLNADDASLDLDSDGLLNLAEFELCTTQSDDDCTNLALDNVVPDIALETPLSFDATGYLTQIALEVSATDVLDGPVDVTLVEGSTELRPGAHTLVWQAQDSAGNIGTRSQAIEIRPFIEFAGSKVTGEGKDISVSVSLSGDAASYPVTASISTSGDVDSGDFTLSSQSIEIDETAEATLVVSILSDSVTEGDETLLLSLSDVSTNAVLPVLAEYQILIVDRNVAPEALLTLTQNDQQTSTVYQDAGDALVTLVVSDANDDSTTSGWNTGTVSGSVSDDLTSFTFDPQALTVGNVYEVSVDVSDGESTTTTFLSFLIAAAQPILDVTADSDGDGIDDVTEGLADSDGDGVADYQDAVNDPTKLSAGDDASDATNLMAVEGGLQMSLGSTALGNGQGGAFIGSDAITDDDGNVIEDGDFDVIGGLYDFVVKGLSEASRTARIVIPLSQSVPADASYRKFSEGQWFEFIENGTDFIESANKVNNACPEPGSALYQLGLLRFADCLQLNISDGGPNDADGQENGVIVDPSGVAAEASSSTTQVLSAPTEQPSGSGSLGMWSFFGLLTLLLFRWFQLNPHLILRCKS